MKFLIDGSESRLNKRIEQAGHLIEGQLLTPLTAYKRNQEVFGIDNGAFSGLDLKGFKRILKNQYEHRANCKFVAIPDKVANHKETLKMYEEYESLADGYIKAFVIQDGFDYWPDNIGAIFVGGSTEFKDSYECEQIVRKALSDGFHVHIGRVNTFDRFYHYHKVGAHTCDGSGVSMYDHMIERIAHLFKIAELNSVAWHSRKAELRSQAVFDF